jgi:hypothetical protein
LVIGVLMMALLSAPWMIWIGGVLSAGLVHALGQPLATTLINNEVSDVERATVLSCANLVSGLYGGLLMLLVGPLLHITTFSTMLLVCLAITLGLALYPLRRLIWP